MGGGVIFGWAKPVPVDSRRLRNPKKDHILIAAAGPATNVVAALSFLIGLKIMTLFSPMVMRGDHTFYPLFLICYVGLFLNVILAVFNLIPIPPLDGSWVLSGLLPHDLSVLYDRIRPFGFMLLILLLFSGALGEIIGPVWGFVQGLIV
jgi:Zn-dependent protease